MVGISTPVDLSDYMKYSEYDPGKNDEIDWDKFDLRHSLDVFTEEKALTALTPTNKTETKALRAGHVWIKYEGKYATQIGYTRLYVNGALVENMDTLSDVAFVAQEFFSAAAVTAGDLVQIYLEGADATSVTTIRRVQVWIGEE